MAKKKKLNEQIGNFVRVYLPKFQDAIKQVEVESANAPSAKLTGTQKLDRAVELVNSVVDIPLLPEAVEAVVFKLVITTIVEMLNARFGKQWLATTATDVP